MNPMFRRARLLQRGVLTAVGAAVLMTGFSLLLRTVGLTVPAAPAFGGWFLAFWALLMGRLLIPVRPRVWSATGILAMDLTMVVLATLMTVTLVRP